MDTKQDILIKITNNILEKTTQDQITPEGVAEILTSITNLIPDTITTLSGNTLNLPDGQTIEIEPDTKATINSGIITFADGQTYDLGTIDTDTFATIQNGVITTPDGIQHPYSEEDTFAVFDGNNIITFADDSVLNLSDFQVTVSNGLTKDINNDIKFGGTLQENTTIELSDRSLLFRRSDLNGFQQLLLDENLTFLGSPGTTTFSADSDLQIASNFISLTVQGSSPGDFTVQPKNHLFNNSQVGHVLTKVSQNGATEWRALLGSNFAVVKFGAITHTPQLGSVENYYNSIDDVLLDISNNYAGIEFKIYIASDGDFILDTTGSLKNITIVSDFAPNIITQSNNFGTSTQPSVIFVNGGINAPGATLTTHFNQTIEFKGETVLRIKAIKRNQNTYTSGFVGRRPLLFSDNEEGSFYNINVEIDEFNTVFSTSSSGDYVGYNTDSLFQCSNYNTINFRVNKLIAGISTNLAAGLQIFNGTLLGKEFNLYINELDLSQEQINLNRLNIFATFIDAPDSNFNVNINKITGRADNWNVLNQAISGNWDIKINKTPTDNLGGEIKILDISSAPKKLSVNIDVKGQQLSTDNNPLVITTPSADLANYENIFVKIHANGTFTNLVQTYNYATTGGLDTTPLVIIDGGQVKINGEHVLVLTGNNPIQNEFVRYVNNPSIEFLSTKDYVIAYNNLTDNSTQNQLEGTVNVYGSIFHNATNTNYLNTDNYRITKPFSNLLEVKGDD